MGDLIKTYLLPEILFLSRGQTIAVETVLPRKCYSQRIKPKGSSRIKLKENQGPLLYCNTESIESNAYLQTAYQGHIYP